MNEQEAAARFAMRAMQVKEVLEGVECDYAWYTSHNGGLNTLGQQLYVLTCKALVYAYKCLMGRARTLAPVQDTMMMSDPIAEPVLLVAE
jgi:hypothetical protein